VAGYSEKPLWKKLGCKADFAACVENEPAGYLQMLELPHGIPVKWVKRAAVRIDFVHLFASWKSEFGAKLKFFRGAIPSDGVIWISWPKEGSGVVTDNTEDTIRAVTLPAGLVDIKVCAVDEILSGFKIMIRKELR